MEKEKARLQPRIATDEKLWCYRPVWEGGILKIQGK